MGFNPGFNSNCRLPRRFVSRKYGGNVVCRFHCLPNVSEGFNSAKQGYSNQAGFKYGTRPTWYPLGCDSIVENGLVPFCFNAFRKGSSPFPTNALCWYGRRERSLVPAKQGMRRSGWLRCVGNGLAPFRLGIHTEGDTLSASLPGQGPFPTCPKW